MSVLSIIRAVLTAQMAGVPDIGQVHDRERFHKNEASFRALYVTTPAGKPEQLRGWWLARTATQEVTVSNCTVMNVHTWQWRGYMAFADEQATALEFDELIETYRALVRQNPTLGGVCEQNPMDGGSDADGVQVLDSGPVMFCGVLCHSALLELKTWSYL
jgi:hypothetical protein